VDPAPFPTVAECGACARAWTADQTVCLYCGWSPVAPEGTYGVEVPRSTHRQGDMLVRFVLSSLGLVPLSAFLVRSALAGGDPRAWAWAVACLGVGPLPLVAQLLRRARGPVRTGAEGLEIEGRRLAWGRVASVRALGHAAGEGPDGTRLLRLLGRGRGSFGTVLAGMGGSGLIALSPWHPRLRIVLTGGERLDLHDLEEPEAFLRIVRARTEGPARAVA